MQGSTINLNFYCYIFAGTSGSSDMWAYGKMKSQDRRPTLLLRRNSYDNICLMFSTLCLLMSILQKIYIVSQFIWNWDHIFLKENAWNSAILHYGIKNSVEPLIFLLYETPTTQLSYFLFSAQNDVELSFADSL